MTKAQFPNEQTTDGQYDRQEDEFRDWVTNDGNSGYPATKGRYHLYVSWACPWAHRTIITRTIKGLENVVGMTVVDPIRDDRGWAFREGPGHTADPINGFQFLSEAYIATNPDFQSRVTVPVLWDSETQRIVSNSDDDIMRMLNQAFQQWTNSPVDLYPENLRQEIDTLNIFIYENINNGVYRAGFATSQEAYEHAVTKLFDALDQMEKRLSIQRYLFGQRIVETDWRFFVTLIRFDAVYFGHFKTNRQLLADYPAISGYVRELYQVPGVAQTVSFEHIKTHYYASHLMINPTGVIPLGPAQDFSAPHGRERIGEDK